MIQGFYTAATGLTVAQQNQDALAENLAHASVPGYRRRGLAFQSFNQALSQATAASSAHPAQGTQVSQGYTDFQAGSYEHTGNALDVALRGDGFFVLDGPRGPVYTRNGSFQLNAQGELQSTSGLPVAGSDGRVTIPPRAANISVGSDGTVSADRVAVGKLRVVRFADPQQLVRTGTTLFEAPPGVEPEDGKANLAQGFREGSNVQVVNEMVNMIAGLRHYEAATRALASMSEAIQQRTRGQD